MHDLVVVQSSLCDKRSFLYVKRIHLDLVISGEGIHEAKKLMLGSCINYQVNLWQRKIIFWTRLVKVGKVNTYSPLFSLLGAITTLASQSG